MKYLLYFLFFFCGSQFLQAQNQYQLLWRIDSNGVEAPSYLFGTMHLKDSRIFNFSDSVMLALQRTEVFAMESHPDSIARVVEQRYFENGDTTDVIRRVLNDEEFELFSKHFFEVQGYSYDDLSTKNPFIIGYLLQKEPTSENEKITVVDSYLKGIASIMDKTIKGLEDPESHLFGYESMSDEDLASSIMEMVTYDMTEYDRKMEATIEIYSRGNLDSLQQVFGHELSLYEETLVERNHDMKNSLLKIMNQHSVFAAVGAAHLWDEEGLVELMRKEGYRVTCVDATFTGVSDQFEYDLVKMPWYQTTNSNSGLSIDYPGQPRRSNPFHFLELDLYADIDPDIVYGTFHLDNRISKKESTDAELVTLSKYMFMSNDTVANSAIRKTEEDGHEVLYFDIEEEEDRKISMKIWSSKGFIFAQYINGPEKHTTNALVDHFFNSAVQTEPLQLTSKSSHIHVDTVGAYQVVFPDLDTIIKMKKVEQYGGDMGSAETTIHFVIASDFRNYKNYLIAYNDFPNGYFLEDFYESLDQAHDLFSESGEVIGAIDTIYHEGLEGREAHVIVRDKYSTEVRLFIKGNRMYRIARQNLIPNKQTFEDDGFFDSFSFNDYAPASIRSIKLIDGQHESIVFPEYLIESDTINDFTEIYRASHSIYSVDSMSSSLFSTEVIELSPFYRAEDPDSFYNDQLIFLTGWKDSVIWDQPFNNEQSYGRDFIMQHKRGPVFSKHRMFINNQNYIHLCFYGDSSQFNSATTKAYFNSYRSHGVDIEFDLMASKSKSILAGLLSTDTLVVAKSKGAMHFYEFSAEDLPELHRLMRRQFVDDTTSDNCTRCLIASNIIYVDDSSSHTLLEDLYLDENTTDVIRTEILNSLSWYEGERMKGLFYKLFLKKQPVNPSLSWSLISPFYDTLSLVVEESELFFDLLKNDSYRGSLLNVYAAMIDEEDKKYEDHCREHKDLLFASAMKDLENHKKVKAKDPDGYNEMLGFYSYSRLLTKFENKELAESLSTELAKLDTSAYKSGQLAAIRIMNDLPVSKNEITKLFEQHPSKYSVIKALKSKGLIKQIPKTYRSTAAMHKIALNDYLADEDYYSDQIKELGTIVCNTKMLQAYRVTFGSEDEEYKYSYIALSGPVQSSIETFDFDAISSYSNYEIEDKGWQTQAEEMCEEYEEYGY